MALFLSKFSVVKLSNFWMCFIQVYVPYSIRSFCNFPGLSELLYLKLELSNLVLGSTSDFYFFRVSWQFLSIVHFLYPMCGLHVSTVQAANVVVVSLYNTYCCMFFESIKQIFIEFHLPKIPAKNRMAYKVSRNSVGNFDQPSQDCLFFLEIWKFQKFPVLFGITTWYDICSKFP